MSAALYALSTDPPDPARSTLDAQLTYLSGTLNRLRTRLAVAELQAHNHGLTTLSAASRRSLEHLLDAELLPVLEDLGLGMGEVYGARLAALEEAAEIAAEAEKIADAQRELAGIDRTDQH